MNYIRIMTEGTDEKALIDVLIEKDLLKFNLEELVFEQCFHKRQIDDELLSIIRQLPYDDKVIVYRVGDKLSEKFDTRKKDIPGKIVEVNKVCTLPELEMLFIINEGMFDEYMKVKSSCLPSQFYKSKNRKYRKQAAFVFDYFKNMTIEEIVDLLKRYTEKRKRAHDKDQRTLCDLLKEDKFNN